MNETKTNSMTIKLVSIELNQSQRCGPNATGICELPTGAQPKFTVNKNYSDKTQPAVYIEGIDKSAIQVLGITLDVTKIQAAFLKLVAEAEEKRAADFRIGLGITYDNHPLHKFNTSQLTERNGWALSKTREEYVKSGSTWLHLTKTIEYKNSSMKALISFEENRGWYELSINNNRVKRSKKYQTIEDAYTEAVTSFKTNRDGQLLEMKQKEETKNELSTVLRMEVENVKEYKSYQGYRRGGASGYYVSKNKVMIEKAKESYDDKYVLFNKGSKPDTLRVDSWKIGDITISQFKAIVNILKEE